MSALVLIVFASIYMVFMFGMLGWMVKRVHVKQVNRFKSQKVSPSLFQILDDEEVKKQ